MEIVKADPNSPCFEKLIRYAEACSWDGVGRHLAGMLENGAFTDWESAFAAVVEGNVVGFCTFMKADYYPDNRYSPWISSIFVDEKHRGSRISEKLIQAAIEYAKSLGFSRVYIPSDITGLYEKYGFVRIDELENYGGGIDHVFMKEI